MNTDTRSGDRRLSGFKVGAAAVLMLCIIGVGLWFFLERVYYAPQESAPRTAQVSLRLTTSCPWTFAECPKSP